VDMNWRKSTYSSGSSGNCVEVAAAGVILVRDTTNWAGGTLVVSASAWSAFAASLR
jgi:hypothetical protein